MGHPYTAALEADVLYLPEKTRPHMGGSHQVIKSLPDVHSADHRFFGPYFLFITGGGFPQADPFGYPVFDNDLIHRAAGSNDDAIGNGRSNDGVKVIVHAPARHAQSTVHGQCNITPQGRNGYPFPVTGRPGIPGNCRLHHFKGFGLAVFIHEIKQGHVKQFLAPEGRIMLFIDLHIRNIVNSCFNFRRMRRSPEN